MELIILFGGVIGAIILKDLYLLYRVVYQFKQPEILNKSIPFITVLVAARNESTTIERCMEGLLDQDYPSDKYEILVGDDESEDDTYSIINNIAKKNHQVNGFKINKLVVPARGKMNVLVQLIEHARGEYYLFTDADTSVCNTWVSTLSNVLQSGCGIVTGTTLIQHTNLFERFQALDWIQAQAMVKVVEDSGTRVTSLGNNMGVTREAYDSVGGFHGVSFSITEDYELYCAIISKGFQPMHIYNTRSLANTLPMKSIGALLEQRKRWMFGVIRLPATIIVFLLLNALYIPVLIGLLIVSPIVGIVLGLSRWLVLALFLSKLKRLLNQGISAIWLLPFELYQSTINLTSLMYFALPIKARWKGRSFS